jgi:small-conductance mechanosensitive channel
MVSLLLIHNLGFDLQLIGLTDVTKQAEDIAVYNDIFNVVIQLLLWTLIGIILFILWGFILRTLEPKMTKTVINTMRVLGRMLIVPFTFIGFLNNFPAFQGTLLSISAIFGAAIGFASATTVGNFLAGLYIMAVRPFLIGDYIILPDTKGIEGRVKEIAINYTKITLPTGNVVLVSNGKFLGQSIINTRTTEDALLFRKDATRIFEYPLIWGANSDEKHKFTVEAIEKTAEAFQQRLTAPVTWFVSSRNRLDRVYQINLVSDSATKLLDITSDFMTLLTENYDQIKENYRGE